MPVCRPVGERSLLVGLSTPGPESRSWQGFGRLKRGSGRAGQAEVHLSGPVPGDGIVGSDGSVLAAVGLRPVGEVDSVGEVSSRDSRSHFRGAEPALP